MGNKAERLGRQKIQEENPVSLVAMGLLPWASAWPRFLLKGGMKIYRALLFHRSMNPCALAKLFLIYRSKSGRRINQKMCLKVQCVLCLLDRKKRSRQSFGHHAIEVPLLTTKLLNIFLLLQLHLPLFLQRLLCILSCISFVGSFLFRNYLLLSKVNIFIVLLHNSFL